MLLNSLKSQDQLQASKSEDALPRSLYLSRTGMLEPLGQSQVLSYLNGLANHFRITLISFERMTDLRDEVHLADVESFCERRGISWIRRRYRRRPRALASGWNLARLIALTMLHALKSRAVLIHARSYIPAAAAWVAWRLIGTPFIFDMRSLWPEELVTSGRLRRGSWLYDRIVWMEGRMLKDAAAVVSLTRAAIGYLESTHPGALDSTRVHVIPTCTDLARFRPLPKKINRPLVFGCHGSILNGWFQVELLARIFEQLATRVPEARFEIITRSPADLVRAALNGAPGYVDRLAVFAAPASDVHRHLQHHDVSLFFYASGEKSELGRSPTRMGEALGCGVPVFTNSQIGDVSAVVQARGVGAIIEDESDAALNRAITQVLAMARDPEISARCRSAAEAAYSLEAGTEAYAALYSDIINKFGLQRPQGDVAL